MDKHEFEVGENTINGNVNECLVCKKKFKLKEKVVLCPIQEPRKGFANVMCIPIHTKCYWVEKD